MLTGWKGKKKGERHIRLCLTAYKLQKRKERRGRWEVLIENNLVISIASSLEKSIFGRLEEKMSKPIKNPLTFLSLPNSSKSYVLLYFISFVFYQSYFTSNHIQNPETAAYMRGVGGCLCVHYTIQYGDLHKGSRLAGWCT